MKNLVLIFWILCFVVIEIFALLPSLAPPNGVDKILHILAFAFLMFIPSCLIRSKKALIGIGLFLFAAGVSNEFLQMHLVGRTASAADAFSNAIGIFAGALTAKHVLTSSLAKRIMKFLNLDNGRA